jgi:uncharacterized protein YukE
MKKSTEEIGQLMDYEKISTIHPLELPKIEKQDIPGFIRCPKYEKAMSKLNQVMERYQGKVDRCSEAIEESERTIEQMKRKHARLDPGMGFFVDKSDGQAVARYNDRIDQMRAMADKIENALERHNDLIDKHTEAVEEANEKRRELMEEALLVIDEDIVAVLDRCMKIIDKLDASQNAEDLIEAIEICLVALRIYAMFEDNIEENDARKDCRERIAKVNQMFAALCTNGHVLGYLTDMYRRNLNLVQKNVDIYQQVVQVVGSVDQEQLTTLTCSIDTVLAEKINTYFEYEGVIDPAELDAIIVNINKTIDALNQSIAKANEAATNADELAKTGANVHRQAETLLASMKSNVEAMRNDILSRSHFASQMIEEAVIDNFYHKDLRSAVTALRQHLVGAIGGEHLDGMIGDDDRFSLEKAHSVIIEAELVRLQTILGKVPEHIKKMTELITVAESDIRKANEVPRNNADALNAEIGKKYICTCFPVFGCIFAFGILGRVKAFESAFRSTNQIYRGLGNTLLLKNSKMIPVIMVFSAILGVGGMAAFFVLDLGHSVAMNAGIPGAVLVFYFITYLGLSSVGKRLRSFLGVS